MEVYYFWAQTREIIENQNKGINQDFEKHLNELNLVDSYKIHYSL